MCTIPSRLHARCRANASEKILVANSLPGPPVWVIRKKLPSAQWYHASALHAYKDNSVREKSTATHGKTSHPACAVPTPVTKRDKKKRFPRVKSALVRFSVSHRSHIPASSFCKCRKHARTQTAYHKTSDPVAQQEKVMRSNIHDTACELFMDIMGRRSENAPKTEPS